MAVDTLAEGVASNLESAAVATRTMTSGIVGGFLSGMMFGASMGFYIGRRFGKEKIKAEAFEVSQREVENIREFYRANKDEAKGPVDFHPDEAVVVRPSATGVRVQQKPSVEEIVEERGYSTRAPSEGEPERPLPPPVPVSPTPRRSAGPRSRLTTEPPARENQWNYATEAKTRSPDHPYIIHENEFVNSETGYGKVEYTYYEGDNVLVGEDERPLPDVNGTVGLGNLRFGHGAQDDDVVFVRNDRLNLEMEITRVTGQYEEEVLGLDTHDSS